MKSHYCKVEKTTIEFEGECNWCGEKDMTKDEALKMAIEAMQFEDKSWECEHGFNHDECPNEHCIEKNWFATIQACKEALEQPAQEPVAWENPTYNYAVHHKVAPSWQRLSDDEILQCMRLPIGWQQVARAIEQALRNKNGY